jgi:hypothetical protein
VRIVQDYLRAKDAQLPRLFSRVFSPAGRFVATYASPGPFREEGPQDGLPAIVEVFRRMGQACENIITVVPVETLIEHGRTLTSQWVVALTTRSGDGGFVGWGSYRWTWSADGRRADELAVRFEGSRPLSVDDAPTLLDDLLELPHPWCTQSAIQQATSSMASLADLRAWLAPRETEAPR